MELASASLIASPMTLAPEGMPNMLSHETSNSSLPHSPDTASNNSNANRKRRPSKGTSAAAIKRSASSPSVRSLSTSSDTSGSLAEKRRNKLGYHRTSVACVHCRRRKIRCLLAPDDHQSRCSNCIRLKKECNFYPVDQQPPLDRRPRTGSKAEGHSEDASASPSSSPSMPTGHPMEHVDQFNQYPMLPISSHPYGPPSAALVGNALSPPGSAAMTTRFDFPDQPSRSGWDPHYYESPGGHSISDEHPQNGFWIKTSDTPITPSSFSPYNSAPPASAYPQLRDSNGAFGSFGSAKTDVGWHQPTRSMSYSQLEDMSHHGPDSYNQIYQPEMRRNTSDMLPPSLRNSTSSSATSVPEPPQHPLSGPATSQPLIQFGGSQGWNGFPTQSPKSLDFGHWYNESSQLPKVQEEELSPHYVEDPALLYAATTH